MIMKSLKNTFYSSLNKYEYCENSVSIYIQSIHNGDSNEKESCERSLTDMIEEFSLSGNTIKNFSGKVCDSDQWIISLSIYEKKWSDKKLMAFSTIQMVKDAKIWYEAMVEDELHTFSEFKKEFNEKYFTKKELMIILNFID
ncbi:hypothetical protein EDEG_01650 [Edhazardia aedis USNM 41457]|uniref:Uncharacterized protein n=1 Tax=Edhazardia aedis (strain USNM 41457) TaxID=1003232 RepID=J9D9C0_EDHAE|nr:hypothetical protein EDEG_01650 [Edhazardia aedis USNM 41457]|eukprot:EJW04074.1 hypothetical protein EDEG_01650 [Edhazardia aedis USNM 41457]